MSSGPATPRARAGRRLRRMPRRPASPRRAVRRRRADPSAIGEIQSATRTFRQDVEGLASSTRALGTLRGARDLILDAELAERVAELDGLLGRRMGRPTADDSDEG